LVWNVALEPGALRFFRLPVLRVGVDRRAEAVNVSLELRDAPQLNLQRLGVPVHASFNTREPVINLDRSTSAGRCFPGHRQAPWPDDAVQVGCQ
jgi:hypothetical protein